MCCKASAQADLVCCAAGACMQVNTPLAPAGYWLWSSTNRTVVALASSAFCSRQRSQQEPLMLLERCSSAGARRYVHAGAAAHSLAGHAPARAP